MSSTMELNQDTLQQIGEYVKQHLPEWQRVTGGAAGSRGGTALSAEEVRRDIALGERIVRVEEELKTQRDLIREGFAEVNKRFEEQTAAFNKRFEEQTAAFNKRFEEQMAYFNTRFDDVNKRFEEQMASINARFDDVNRRFEAMHRYTNRWMVLISLFLAMIGAMPWLMGAY